MKRIPTTAALLLAAHGAAAQTLDATALKEISVFASEFCGEYWREGGLERIGAEGSAKAEIDGLLGRLVDLGIEGAADFESEQYVGLLRDELGGEFKSVRDCRLTIWNDLKAGVIEAQPTPAAAPQPAPAPQPEPAPIAPPASGDLGQLYPFTATRFLTPADLAGYGPADLRVMRNEIYARHGYAFQSADLRALFGAMAWYRPSTSDSEAVWRAMSDVERANVETIKSLE